MIVSLLLGGGGGAPDAYFALTAAPAALLSLALRSGSLSRRKDVLICLFTSASLVIMFVVLAHGIPIQIDILATVHLSRNAAAFQYWYFIQTDRDKNLK
jgi:hypothetical protein